jgi:Flp pilus assembly protein TadB
MLKFLPGLLLLELITVCLMLLAPESLTGWGWLRLAVPLAIIATLMALWFSAMSTQQRKDEIMRLQESHAREREKIKVNAERAKHQVTKDAQKQVQQEIKRTTAQANFKVGLAVAGAASLGGFLLLTQFVTIGVLLLGTAGGTLGGYLLRLKQEKANQTLRLVKPAEDSPKLINSENKAS